MKFPSLQFEEILTSLVGSILLGDTEAGRTLVWKATSELAELNLPAASIVQFVERLRRLLRYSL